MFPAIARRAQGFAEQADERAVAVEHLEPFLRHSPGAGDAPGELARRVASPGGVTQAGLDALDEGEALRRLIAKTLRAARDRSAEMAAEARGNG